MYIFIELHMMRYLLVFFLLQTAAYADLDKLHNKKRALEIELGLVRETPATYYLVLDLQAQIVYLKADANLIRACKVINTFGPLPPHTQALVLHTHVKPYAPIASPNRLLPLNFSNRLTQGPKHRSRLYFTPSFLIQSADLPPHRSVAGIGLENHDIKALASALTQPNQAIFIPAHLPVSDDSK